MMPLLSFVILAEGENIIEREIRRWLLVAGGFLVGFILTEIILKVVSKFILKRKFPHGLSQVFRWAGGITAAIIVYLLLATGGGDGVGGPGGGKTSGNTDTTPGKNQEQPKEEIKKDPKKDPTTPNKGKLEGTEERVEITVLKFDPAKKFFFFQKDVVPRDEDEIIKLIEDHEKPVKVVQINVYLESAYQAGTALQDRVQKKGLVADLRRLPISLTDR